MDKFSENKQKINNEMIDKKEYRINGYDVFLVNRNIIKDDLIEEDSLKELIRDIANSPDLQVYKDGVRMIHGDFDKFRDELWKNKDLKESSINISLEAVINALNQNTFTRIHQLEGIIVTVRDNEHYEEWHERFNQINSIEDIKQKTKQIDNLSIEIYNNI